MGNLASGSIDLKSLKVAGEGATNYLEFNSTNGLRISQAKDYTKPYVQITNNGINIIKDTTHKASLGSNGMEVFVDSTTNSIASFGAETRIGRADNSHALIDYHSFQLIYGAETDPYVYFSDLRDTNGEAEVYDYYVALRAGTHTFTASQRIVEYHGCYTSSSATISRSGSTFTLTNVSAGDTFIFYYLTDDEFRAYSLGARQLIPVSSSLDVNAIGNYSFTAGKDCAAISMGSMAQGLQSTAYGKFSRALGYYTNSYGIYSHAEGDHNDTYGMSSHAEGSYNTTYGDYSHVGGYHTVATGSSQTVIGRFNEDHVSGTSYINAGDYAFIIGNGSTNSRSNALTVDWSGNVDIASGAKYKINGTALSASDVGAVPTTRTVNSKALSSDITLSASDVNAVPTSRTVNSKALSSDITLSASDVGAATSTHTHGNITNAGDITATAPTIASGDKLIINDESASKITNGPSFGTAKNTFLANDGTWVDPITITHLSPADKSSLSTGTTLQNISSFTLPAGKWHIDINVRFPSNATGRRHIALATASGNSTLGNIYGDTRNATNGGVTECHISVPYYNSASKTMYVNGFQNSGSALANVSTRVSYFGVAI